MFVNGVNLNVKTTGSGPPIVALHGFAGNMSTWTKFVKEAKKDHTIITIDLLGHGRSDSPPRSKRYRLERSIADITKVLRKLSVSPPCWLGYSMGGRIALLAATMNPKSCRCLVLEGASPGLASQSARNRRKKQDAALAEFIIEEGVEPFVNYWERRPLFKSQRVLSLSLRKEIRKQRLRNNPIGLANTLLAANPAAQPQIHNSLRKLKMPVLCIVGEYDHKFRSLAKEMCTELPNGRLVVIPGAGHAAHLERPREFNRAVLGFLERID